jgi:hypothetical protein
MGRCRQVSNQFLEGSIAHGSDPYLIPATSTSLLSHAGIELASPS